MQQTWKYISTADEAQIAGFLNHYARRFFLVPNGPLYHYTTGENLISIINSGELWATQASCLNDATELVYSAELLHRRVKAKIAAQHNPAIDPILTRLSEALSTPGVEISPVFVACFSERRDDLSQWRAYSGGEGGYAIQFDPVKLREAGILPTPQGIMEPQILLVRVEYDPASHAAMFDDILKWTEQYFLGLQGAQKAPTIDEWADEFCRYWLEHLAFYAPCVKNPAFRDEREWRLIYYLRPDDPTKIKFRQRQSMMSRHIPLRLKKLLPISGVLVGPCRHPRLSQIAASDLLVTGGYDPTVVKVETTEVPYRTT
jgi:Protein of unknown function (DUF2971)